MRVDLATLRAAKTYAKQDYEKQTLSPGGDAIDGIPAVHGESVADWGTPQGWEAFKVQYGFYPFGMQNGTMVRPGNVGDAPGWALDMMGLRRRPGQ